MRVLLISLYCFDSINTRFLSGVLKKQGHQVDLLHFKDTSYGKMLPPTNTEIRLAAGLAKDLKPDLIGLSVRSSFLNIARLLSTALRIEVDAPQLWGGVHPTLCPEECMDHADIILRGEGEGALCEIADRWDRGESLDGIIGLMQKNNRELKSGNDPFVHDDIDAISIPDLDYDSHFTIDDDGLKPGKALTWQRVYYTMRTRGCPFQCTYCNTPSLRRIYSDVPAFRTRSLDNLMAELYLAKEKLPGLKRMFFYDDIFTTRKDDGFLEEFAHRYPKEIGLPFGFWQHPSLLDEKTFRILVPAGLKLVGMGLQSGSEQIRKEIFKRNTPDTMIRKAQWLLHKYKVEHAVEIIGDLPYETETTCRDSLELLLSFKRPFRLSLFSLTYLPKTELTKRLLQEGLINPKQIEGENDKALELRLSFDQERDACKQFYYGLFFLTSKRFIPKGLIRWLAGSPWLKMHPFPVILAAKGANLLSAVLWGTRLILHGEMDKQRFLRGWRSRKANLR